jgi:O-antigen/teichoic acid export membrane protein
MGEDKFEKHSGTSESSESKIKPAPQSTLDAGLLILAGIVAFGVLIYFGIPQGILGWVVIPAIPLVLLWFVYRVFLRRLIRIRKIRGIRERRWLREAAQRKRD